MDASAKTIRKILDSGDQFLIPFFQRNYSWTRKHWERLRLDIWALLEEGGTNQHFLGPLVCTLFRANPGEVPAYLLIDGQQRLTTLSVLMAALRDVCNDLGFSKLSAKIHEGYLVHRYEDHLQHYKIVPRTGDREVLIAIIEREIEPPHKRFGIYRAWRFFRKHITNHTRQAGDNAERQLNAIFSVVADRLSLVVITISGENPYEIFESLNSTGLPLEESDLVRNFIFMQVPLLDQEKFSTSRWGKFEGLFDESESEPAIPATPFYRNYLMREGTYSKAKATFIDFRSQNRERDLSPEDQVEELKRFAEYEVQLRRPSTCADAALRNRLINIGQLDITTAHTLLLALMDRHANKSISKDELLGCIDDLASFVLRRSVCGESTRAYGRWFCEAIKKIEDSPRDDLRGYWFHRGWPDDEAFIARLQDFPIYRRESKKARLVLMALEDSYSRKEHVDPVTLTIEHVMPQTIGNTKAGKSWQDMLGEDWLVVHQKHLHTLGNLTLTGYNQELGNRSFDDKKKELANSKMLLNKPIAQLDEWDENAILNRGERLARETAKLWPRPGGRSLIYAAYHCPHAGGSVQAEAVPARLLVRARPHFGEEERRHQTEGDRGEDIPRFLDRERRRLFCGPGLFGSGRKSASASVCGESAGEVSTRCCWKRGMTSSARSGRSFAGSTDRPATCPSRSRVMFFAMRPNGLSSTSG